MTEPVKEYVKELMKIYISEVDAEAFKVDGSINGNELLTQGFYMFKRALLEKIEKDD